MSIPRIIPTASLTLDDVPFPEAKWRTLADFATTFDPCEIDDYGAKTADLDNALSTSSLVELRSHLYVEQRRWNHFGEEPDGDTMRKLREIISLIRKKTVAK